MPLICDSAAVEVVGPEVSSDDLPLNVLQAPIGSPIGVTNNCMPPVVVGGEPECLGVSTYRWSVALPPSDFTAANPLNTTYKAVPDVNSQCRTPVGDGRCTLDLSSWILPKEILPALRKADSIVVLAYAGLLREL